MRRGLAPSRNSQQESGANLFTVGNKSNGGDWVPLNARSERRWGLCAEPLQAGPRCGWAAAGTSLCRPPQGQQMPSTPGSPPAREHPLPRPMGPQPPRGGCEPRHPAGGRGKGGGRGGSRLLPAARGLVLPGRAGVPAPQGARAAALPPSAPRPPSRHTKNQRWLTWFQRVFPHD